MLSLSADVTAARTDWANAEGGDVGSAGSRRSLLRHTAHYLAAAELAEQHGPVRRLVDVGGGVGALGTWLARRLGVGLHLVDADPQVRAVADAAFADVTVHDDLGALPPASADLVTAMEVVEHIAPSDQPGFVAGLARLLAPGGLLVVSTPDETGYLGGWSGYAPHVGVLDAAGLEQLVADQTGLPTTVWRLEGEPYDLTRWDRVALPLVNRVWGAVHAAIPDVVGRVGHTVGAALTAARGWRRPTSGQVQLPGGVRAVAPADGAGTGLLAVVWRPAD